VTVRSVRSFHSHDMLVAGEVGTVVGDGGSETVYAAALEIRTDRIRGMLQDNARVLSGPRSTGEDLDGDGLDLRDSRDRGSRVIQHGRCAGRPGGVGELVELGNFDVVL
jgi:hypothetical protein